MFVYYLSPGTLRSFRRFNHMWTGILVAMQPLSIVEFAYFITARIPIASNSNTLVPQYLRFQHDMECQTYGIYPSAAG
jgi:hypothetical protein